MPSLLVMNPDDAAPVRSVTKPIVIVFDAGLALDPGLLDPGLEALHAARAVQAATTRTAHPEICLRIGEPLATGGLHRDNATPGGASCPSHGRQHYRNRYGHDYGMDRHPAGSPAPPALT